MFQSFELVRPTLKATDPSVLKSGTYTARDNIWHIPNLFIP